jgi:hypothetical protein
MRYLVFIILLFSSCSAQWHIDRAIKKDPSILRPDTIIKYDTTIIFKDRFLYDTFTTTEYDTVVMQDSFVYTKVIRIKDKIKVYTKCKGDTVRIKEVITMPARVVVQKDSLSENILLFALLICCIFLFRFVFK